MPERTLPPLRADLLIQSITGCAIYMVDPAGIVSSWNAGAERMKGYEPGEIIGQHFSRFYPEEDRAAADNALRMALIAGGFETEGWRIRKDGTRFWATVVIEPIHEPGGELVGFAKITRDLSEKKHAEEALQRSEERFRLLVQGVTDYAIYMLDTEGHVSSWNAGAERTKGYSAGEIIGQHFSRFYPEEDRLAGVPKRALETAASEGRFEAEGWRLRKDGSRFWASVVIDPIRDDEGRLIGFTKITRDLTERKRAQEALEKSQEQFFQAQKVEAIGKLTGGVAHDFNNILAAILGSLQIAQRRIADGQDGGRFIENAIKAADRGAMLTQRMLAFARKQELQLEPVDVINSVREMAELMQRTLGPGVTIRPNFPLRLRAVLADRTQLELAVMNLMVNARDAMPNGGTITVSARESEQVAGDRAFVCLSIKDEGEGMDAETLAHATEPFFTTKGVGKGTGLGLSMVQGMVEQCGGRLVMESAPGQGTTAEIWLPVVKQEAEMMIVEADQLPSSGKPLRILAVDDDAIILLNTATILDDMGHEVLQAHSARSALEIIQREEVDLLITDYSMPRMTGAELVELALRAKPDLKVIVASGYADLPEGTALDVPRLAKPFSEHDLASAIAALSD